MLFSWDARRANDLTASTAFVTLSGGGLARRLIVRIDPPDDFQRRFFHPRKPPLGEIRSCGRPGRGEQEDEQHNYNGQDHHRRTSSEAKTAPGPEHPQGG